eukprot:TRINITY_DN2110_c0_g1_i2.p2 TRINITY_DN2110_c0_g1~~TRINITY_DN2110_c0_g1_i2.p2  ORF type:complete len:191 (-),score=-4.71 TRINITY_DN2110_c0_g1_i2:101-673(-)
MKKQRWIDFVCVSVFYQLYNQKKKLQFSQRYFTNIKVISIWQFQILRSNLMYWNYCDLQWSYELSYIHWCNCVLFQFNFLKKKNFTLFNIIYFQIKILHEIIKINLLCGLCTSSSGKNIVIGNQLYCFTIICWNVIQLGTARQGWIVWMVTSQVVKLKSQKLSFGFVQTIFLVVLWQQTKSLPLWYIKPF